MLSHFISGQEKELVDSFSTFTHDLSSIYSQLKEKLGDVERLTPSLTGVSLGSVPKGKRRKAKTSSTTTTVCSTKSQRSSDLDSCPGGQGYDLLAKNSISTPSLDIDQQPTVGFCWKVQGERALSVKSATTLTHIILAIPGRVASDDPLLAEDFSKEVELLEKPQIVPERRTKSSIMSSSVGTLPRPHTISKASTVLTIETLKPPTPRSETSRRTDHSRSFRLDDRQVKPNLSSIHFKPPSILSSPHYKLANALSLQRSSISRSPEVSTKTSILSGTSSNNFRWNQRSDTSTFRFDQKVLGSKPSSPKTSSRSPTSVSRMSKSESEMLQHYKGIVEAAVKQRKTFTICGTFGYIRKALQDRGWVEKMRIGQWTEDKELYKKLFSLSVQELCSVAKSAENAIKVRRVLISKLLGMNHQVDFYWDYNTEPFKTNPDSTKFTIINKLRRNPMYNYTCKHGLCRLLKHWYWAYSPGQCDILFPRTYFLSDYDDVKEFTYDFKITSAYSMLKWVAYIAKGNTHKVVSDYGNVSMSAFYFALRECERYISIREHQDIDRDIMLSKDSEWDCFLQQYYKLVHMMNHFQSANDETKFSITRKAEYMLDRLKKYRAHLYVDGFMNMWILKPQSGSRGEGIHLCRTLQHILETLRSHPDRKYVIQKYLERPLLIYDTKFDIRQWFLVSCADPLTIWIYGEFYLRFSSQPFNLRKLHESIHLTNNSVQCRYKNARRNSSLPIHNMWDSQAFFKYLEKTGRSDRFEGLIRPGMKQAITTSMILSQDALDKRPNCFELYGADFMLTEDCRPWLIEINARPALHHSTQVTARMCPQVLEDTIKVVVDHARDPQASTGKFELCYLESKEPLPLANSDSLSLVGHPAKPSRTTLRQMIPPPPPQPVKTVVVGKRPQRQAGPKSLHASRHQTNISSHLSPTPQSPTSVTSSSSASPSIASTATTNVTQPSKKYPVTTKGGLGRVQTTMPALSPQGFRASSVADAKRTADLSSLTSPPQSKQAEVHLKPVQVVHTSSPSEKVSALSMKNTLQTLLDIVQRERIRRQKLKEHIDTLKPIVSERKRFVRSKLKATLESMKENERQEDHSKKNLVRHVQHVQDNRDLNAAQKSALIGLINNLAVGMFGRNILELKKTVST